MKTLLTMQSLPLVLLLLQPLPLQVLMQHRFSGLSSHMEEEIEDYLSELRSTGPTKPPTKKTFQKQVLLPFESMHETFDCTREMMFKNVHDRWYCREEHFFLQVAFNDLEKTCRRKFVACKNGVRRCHKTKEVIEGYYCKLTNGVKMTDCEYETFYKQGYALITCHWQNDIGEMTPKHVNHILEISDQH